MGLNTGIYVHWDGRRVVVESDATDPTTGNPMVVYCDAETGAVFCAPFDWFQGMVMVKGHGRVKRYKYLATS